jgi:hypothetical protein
MDTLQNNTVLNESAEIEQTISNESSLEKQTTIENNIEELANVDSELLETETIELVEATVSVEKEIVDETSIEESQIGVVSTERIELPTNPEALADQKAKLNELKSNVALISENSKSSDDFKALRKTIVEIKEKILALFAVDKSEKDNLINELQSVFEVLRIRQDNIRETLEIELKENLDKIKPELDELIKNATDSQEFKVAREFLIKAQGILKSVNIKRDVKDEFYKTIQLIFDQVNEKQSSERESYEMECSENYLSIKPKIELVIAESKEANNFKETRQKLIETQSLLKDIKLKREKRDELYGLIREAFNSLNERQDIERAKYDEVSTVGYNIAKTAIDEAIAFAKETSDFKAARESLIKAQSVIKDNNMKRDQRDELYGAVRVVFDDLNSKQGDDRDTYESDCNENNTRLEIRVSEVFNSIEYSNDFREIREGLIAVQDEVKILKLKKDQRNELFKKIREAFDIFDKKRNEFTQKRKEDKFEKLNGVLKGLQNRLTKLNETLITDRQALENQNSKLDSDEALNNHIRENISSIEARITDKESALIEVNSRIEDIHKELESLK